MSPPPESDRMRFADWMARALHDPQRGYYARRVRAVGRRGDFSTSASMGTLLAEAIGHWLEDEIDRQRDIRTVIEVGGGDGSLSAAVRDSLGWWKRRRLQWFMVETSDPLRAQQQKLIGAKHAQWFADITDALRACQGRAVIFHNELIDAFPVRVYQWDAPSQRWQELWVSHESGTWREVMQPVDVQQSDSTALNPTAWAPAPLRDGQRVEAADACRAWLQAWAPQWKRGAMLTVDYGDTFPQIYHRQPHGTVRAYAMQQRLAGSQVYENMGRQDITADVNFTDLIAWGESLGWSTAQFSTQREFLLQHVRSLAGRARNHPAEAFLLDEHGAGSAFKVLVQRRE